MRGAAEDLRDADTGRRVAALRTAGLLDAPPEERFDRLTRLVQGLLRVPVALLTLLDVDRQFFLSALGLPEPWASLRETPLTHSFCRSVVATGLPLSVADVRKDPRLRDNPAIEDLGVVAYLAEPLALPDGCVIGALCAIDREARAWTVEERRALADLAGAVMAEIMAELRLRELEAASATLRDSEARYNALLDVSPQIVWFSDAEGHCTYVNRHYAEFVGIPAEQMTGGGWSSAVHPADRDAVVKSWHAAASGGKAYQAEVRMRRASDGAYRWILFRAAPLCAASGDGEHWIGVGIDIDDNKRATETLQRLIAALGVAVYTTDAAGRITYYNEAAVAIWGWRPPLADARWVESWRIFWPDGTPMPHEESPMAVALRENRPIHGQEVVAVRPDGSRVPFNAYPTPLRDKSGVPIGAVNALVDTTRRKDAEAALVQSEKRLRLALEAGQLAFWEFDLATRRTIHGELQDRIFGYEAPPPDWSFEKFIAHVVPEDRETVERRYREMASGRLNWPTECRIRRAGDGEVRWIEVYGQAVYGPDGLVTRLFGVLHDITDRKRTEAALRESEARLRSILETVPDAMIVFDENGIIESFSAAAESLFGHSAKEAIGKDLAMLLPGQDGDRNDIVLAGYDSRGERRAIGTGRVAVGRRKDGSTFDIEIAVGEARADGRRLFTGFLRDLTERQAAEVRLQELQAQLLHVSRLSAAGEMATAFAHELNQPLTAITSAIQAAQRMLAAAPPVDPRAPVGEVRDAMDLAAEQALRAGQIVRRIRNFVAADGDSDKRVEDLCGLIEEAGSLGLVGARERGVHVSVRFEPGLRPVLVDRIQIQQVLLNLIRNALEAMTWDGDRETPGRRRELAVTACSAGRDMVEVAVSDTGPGLAPEVADRLFSSFVSTKPGGMGMGLSICRSIIGAHGGRLWVEGNPSGGVTFRFTLPAAPPEEAALWESPMET